MRDIRKLREMVCREGEGKVVEERRVARSRWELMVEEEDEEWREVGRKREEDRRAKEERRRKWLEEREKRLKRERRRKEEEKERKLEEERKKRERNVIWRGVDGENDEERLWLVEEILKKTLKKR